MKRKSSDEASGPQAVPLVILLVEDEPAVREVTREALEMAGYDVFEADGPEKAIRYRQPAASENRSSTDRRGDARNDRS